MSQQTQATNVDEYIAEQMAKLSQKPDCANTLYNLGMGYLSKRMFSEAEQAFLRAVDCSGKMAEAYVQLGGIAMYRGDLESCLNYNKLATQTRPFFAVPHANIGFVYLQMGDLENAEKALRKAVKQDPNFIQAWGNLANVHFLKGEFDQAVECADKALELEPHFGPAFNTLALVHAERGEGAKAVECADKAQATGFEVPEAFLKELEQYR